MVATDRKKPKEDFWVRLVNVHLRPWLVPMRVLTRTLDAVQRLMDYSDQPDAAIDFDEQDRPEPPPEISTLHLIDVVSKSAGYKVAAEDSARVRRALKFTGRVIAHPHETEWNSGMLYPIEDLSDIARKLECVIEFREPGSNGEVLATVRPETYRDV